MDDFLRFVRLYYEYGFLIQVEKVRMLKFEKDWILHMFYPNSWKRRNLTYLKLKKMEFYT